MKTINDAMKEANSYGYPNFIGEKHNAFNEGFREGVEFAQTWIDVNDELPEVGEKVLIKTSNNKYLYTEMYIPVDCNGNVLGIKAWSGSGYFRTSITHWKLIELK